MTGYTEQRAQIEFRRGFAGNWVTGGDGSRSQRRRLMATLRLAHSVLGMGRKRLGLGTLGVGGLVAVVTFGLAAPAQAQYAAGGGTATGTSSVAIGAGTQANGAASVALGTNNSATGNASIAIGNAMSVNGLNAIGIGVFANATGINALALGGNARANGEGSSSIGVNSVATAGAAAFGLNARADGTNSLALGYVSRAGGLRATALGFGANAGGLDAIAQGNSANASQQNSIAIGFQATSTAVNAINLGNRTLAGGGALQQGAIAIGTDVTANARDATAIGRQSQATGANAVSMGVLANASAGGAYAFGTNTVASGINSVALGNSADATGAAAMAFGVRAAASGDVTIAMGQDAIASGQNASAFGSGANATGANSLAAGVSANASGIASTALGIGAVTSATNAVAVGVSASASGLNSIYLGSRTFGAGASAQSAIGIGTDVSASATNAIAVGLQSTASSADAVAIGTRANASGGKAVAIGADNTAYGDGAVAIGDPSFASGTGAFTGGANNIANADGTASATAANMASGAVAIGNANVAVGQGSVAIGNTSRAGAAGAVAFGDAAIANFADDVALGSGSTTVAAVGTASTVIGGTTYNFAGTTPASTVSVGALGAERTITNVAAGRISDSSTDAINGSQLFATNQQVTQNTTDIAQNTADITNLGDTITDINTGAGIKYFHANSTLPDSQALGTDSVAVGPNAVANNAGDVAIGLNAASGATTAVSSTVIGGTTYNFAGTTPAGAFSIGSLGAERQIQNVAAGRLSNSSTDAVNGSQLFATNQQVTQNTADITNLGDVITDINTGAGIKYFHANSTLPDSQAIGTDSVAIGPNAVANNAGDVAIGLNAASGATTAVSSAVIGGTTYNFAGATPAGAFSIGSLGAERQIQNVAAGRLSNSSTDAVNGSQLFATNQQVTQNTTDIANLGNTIGDIGDTITNIAGDTSTGYTDANGDGIRYVRTNDRTLPLSDSSAQGIGSTAVGYDATAIADSSLALGRDSQATILGGVALGSGSIADRALAPATGQLAAGPTNFIEYNTTDKTLLGAVSVGTDTSYRQITNVADGTSAQDVVTIRQLQGAIASVATTPSMYFHANSTAGDSLAVGAESIAVGPTTVVNGDNGIGIGNGAIVDQIAPGGTAIGQGAHVMLADGVAIGTQSTAAGVQSVALGAGAQSDHINSVALGAQSITSVGAETNYTAFALAGPQTSVGEVSFGSTGSERKLTNVAAGSAETDAVNVSQLRGMGTQVTNLFGGGSIVNPDGTITGPTYNIQGGNYTTVYDGFTAVDASLTNLNNQINGGGGIKYFHANSTLADSSAAGTDSVAIGPESVASGTDSLAAGHGATAAGQGAVALGEGAQANNANDVALGSGSVTEAAVGTSGTTIRGEQYDFAGTAPVGTVSVGADGAERTVTNVAAGRVSADSTDAVNGSQLHATNTAIDDLASDIGDIGDIADNAVQYDTNPDGSKTNTITLQGGDPNAPVVISNVGAGVANTDAVNVGQLNEGLTENRSYTDNRVEYAIDTANDYTDEVAATTLTEANNYTNQKFDQLNQEFGEVRGEARQAAAIGLAAASLRYDDRPGKVSVAMGGGLWRSEAALAFGAGYTSENGRVRANLSGTTAGGHWGVGAGLSFTLN